MSTNHYARYQQDISNAASSLISQMVCAEKGLDYNQVMHAAQQAHINGILQQEQMRQFNQIVNRHYGGSTFFGKLKEAFGGSAPNFFPMMGGMPGMFPQMPMTPMAPMSPLASMPVAIPMVSAIPASALQPPERVAETDQLRKDVEVLKNMLTQAMQVPPVTHSAQPSTAAGHMNAGQQMPIF